MYGFLADYIKKTGDRNVCFYDHLSSFEVGIGTRLNPGCQDIFGPIPSVFLDKSQQS